MRLLNIRTLEFREFRSNEQPKYVIASHRWVEGCEVTLQDVRNGCNLEKSGYQKIVAFAYFVQQRVPSVQWLWIDTCCIDKQSSAELSKSLNLMFDWYRNAVLCIAYLADVDTTNDHAWEGSDWFKRGWTLQELLAPHLVLFVTNTWKVIGHKGDSACVDFGLVCGPNLEEDLAARTGIPHRILHDYAASSDISWKEKLKWMEGRETAEPEDMWYALYGILDVTLGANYGEKYDGARRRLMDKVHERDEAPIQQAEQRRNITAWLSPPDPWTNHEAARQLREPGTGDWLIQSKKYRLWKDGSVRHLWMYGKAGCGKTILCSTAIEDVKAYCNDHPNAGFAVFYFSFSDDQKQRHSDLLRSLVVQLGRKDPGFSMLKQAYDNRNQSLPGQDEIENILSSCFNSYEKVFLLIDALDECPDEGDARLNMFKCVDRLSKQARNVQILATSRDVTDIRDSMKTLDARFIHIAKRHVDKDIQRYLSSQLSGGSHSPLLRLEASGLIEKTLFEKADGMFRWTYCQVQELRSIKAVKQTDIQDILDNVPPTLDATYARILGKIDYRSRKVATTYLQWLAYAKGPPTLGELAEASRVDPTAQQVSNERAMLDGPLVILPGLVATKNSESGSLVSDGSFRASVREDTMRGEDTRIRLAHLSVKEYLETKRMLQSEEKDFHLESSLGHQFLAQSCLVYLHYYSNSSQKQSKEQDFTTFPLLTYAAKSWFYHSALQQATEPVYELDLLLRNPKTLRDWLLVYQLDTWKRPFSDIGNLKSSLYYASYIGLEQVVRKLLKDPEYIDAPQKCYSEALWAAKSQDHKKVAKLLRAAGAHVHARQVDHDYEMHAASI